MQIFETTLEIQNFLESYKLHHSIGFVPTMGALHRGHTTLIEQSKKENDITVCSIFVNPIQFNNQDDLLKYPRTLNEDIKALEDVGCDVLFYPSVEEMYPFPDVTQYNFGNLEKVMEGKFRPGHFRGVAVVVRRLFEIIRPDKSYFGKKDFQQLKIVESLVHQYQLSPKIIGCEIVRESDGLAMSSRNARLNELQRAEVPLIYKTLKEASLMAKELNVVTLKEEVCNKINSNSQMKVEYFEIADSESLESIQFWNQSANPMGFIVVNVGDIRLIDNINFIL